MFKIFNFRFTRYGARITKLESGEGEMEKFNKLMASKRELHKLMHDNYGYDILK